VIATHDERLLPLADRVVELTPKADRAAGRQHERVKPVALGLPAHDHDEARLERRPEPGGHGVRLTGRAQAESALEQREQLRAHEAHLGGQLHAGLAQEDHAVDAIRVEHDDGLGAEQAVLGAAEAQDVDAGVGRERPERNAQRGGGVPDARTIEVERHAARVRPVGNRLHLSRGVQGAQLGGLGDAHGQGLRAVLVTPSGVSLPSGVGTV